MWLHVSAHTHTHTLNHCGNVRSTVTWSSAWTGNVYETHICTLYMEGFNTTRTRRMHCGQAGSNPPSHTARKIDNEISIFNHGKQKFFSKWAHSTCPVRNIQATICKFHNPFKVYATFLSFGRNYMSGTICIVWIVTVQHYRVCVHIDVG